jgi:hypothetical protein
MSKRAELTLEQRRRRARIAAHASWANTTDRAARPRTGTSAFLRRFEKQVDPDGTLPEEERAQREHHARMAYMLTLSERSAAARRRPSRTCSCRRDSCCFTGMPDSASASRNSADSGGQALMKGSTARPS